MTEGETVPRRRRVPANPIPGITDELLHAVDVLDVQIERLLGPPARLPAAVIRNVNDLEKARMTVGERVADGVAATIGSWRFILIQSGILILWLTLNIAAWISHWDPYPFILLNLALSFQAAYSAPIIMMSQNRQASKDRLTAEEDFRVNRLAEDEIRAILTRLDRQEELLLHVLARVDRATHAPRVEHAQAAVATVDPATGDELLPLPGAGREAE